MRYTSRALLAAALIGAMALVASPAAAQDDASQTGPAPAQPDNLATKDHYLDGGDKIDVTWDLSPDDVDLTKEQKQENADAIEQGEAPPYLKRVLGYSIYRSAESNGLYWLVARGEPDKWDYKAGKMTFTVEKCVRGEEYFFQVAAVGANGVESAKLGPGVGAVAKRQLYDHTRFWMMIITTILCGAVIYWINAARQGKELKVRKIAGLEAVDEAVGRATEMGRSVLFVPGIQDMNDMQTIAGLTVLARVSKTAAEYDAKVEVPTARALVMTAAQETVQGSFIAAGRPDAYNEDLIYYVTDEQFGYVAYLQGMMVREKPAACFYMGTFFAESLILAETGNSIGAIQIAGTAMPAQLPFFVAACDYTLIGEEFFAASAYLSGSAEEIGALKGQDVGKVVVAVGLLLGVLLWTIASLTTSDTDAIQRAAEFIRDTVMV